MRLSTVLRSAQWACVASLLALAQCRIIILVMGNQYYASIEAANGVVHGTPHWVVVQSRVLAPYTIALLTGLFGQFSSAHEVFTLATLAIAGYMVLALTWRRFGSDASWGAFFLFQMLLCLLSNKYWLYAWDQYDIIIFILFADFVLSGKDWRWFIVLFAVGIFNRESALFISLWMILDPLAKALLDRGRAIRRLDWRMLAAGLGTMGVGLGIVYALRSILLVREIGPELFHDSSRAGKWISQYGVPDNIEFLQKVLSHPKSGVVILFFPVVVVGLAFAMLLRDPRRYSAFAATQLAMIGGIMMVGLWDETRVMLDSVPFVVMAFCVLRAKPVVDQRSASMARSNETPKFHA
jgi:hypothetical protein